MPPIKSLATGRVLSDATRAVLLIDNARAKGCTEQPRITTTPIDAEPGQIAERWTVQRCGQTRTYRVRYIPTPQQAGTDVAISGPE